MSPNHTTEENKRLRTLTILVSGQVLNSLTEMVEDYLKDKALALGIIGIASPYAPAGSARTSLYESGTMLFSRKMFNMHFRKQRWYCLYLLPFVFIVYFISIFRAAYRFKMQFDLFVGVSCFSAFVGILLKKLGLVKKVIFYSIDYFPMQKKGFYLYVSHKLFFWMDRYCAQNCDLVWHINPTIAEGRQRFGGLLPGAYQSIRVPLGYTDEVFCPQPFEAIEPYTIGFVGTLNPNQGLQLAVKAMPQIVARFPEAKLVIIGDGIYSAEIKRIAQESACFDKIEFLGFIGDRKKVSQILSRCALGIAPWTMEEDNNIRYADPGKPRHYAFCGLPIIMTRSNVIAEEIDDCRAGIAINYSEEEFVEAVSRLLGDQKLLREYKDNALNFARRYTSKNIFSKAWSQSLALLYPTS